MGRGILPCVYWNCMATLNQVYRLTMDPLLDALFALLCWPFRAWRDSIENSRLGASEWDLETLRFWKKVAIVGVCVLVLLGLGLELFLAHFPA